MLFAVDELRALAERNGVPRERYLMIVSRPAVRAVYVALCNAGDRWVSDQELASEAGLNGGMNYAGARRRDLRKLGLVVEGRIRCTDPVQIHEYRLVTP